MVFPDKSWTGCAARMRPRGYYNTGRPRLTAGFYLWQVEAEGYLQWHARMPTADPYDPTDGREDDFQFLYPAVAPCDESEISEGVIALSEGIGDLRWAMWLDAAAQNNKEARELQDELSNLVSDDGKKRLDSVIRI